MSADDDLAAKCSPRLREAASRGDDSGAQELQVLLRPELSPEARDAVVHEIEEVTGASPHMSFGIASVNAPVTDVARIAALDGVEWIDIASQASIEELLD